MNEATNKIIGMVQDWDWTALERLKSELECLQSDFEQCDRCGSLVESYEEIGGEYVCHNCLEDWHEEQQDIIAGGN